MHSVQTIPFQSNPAFDGTAASTRSEANPDLGYHVKVEVVRALLRACPSAQDIKVELVSTIPGVDATSERAIYDHYGFIQIQATAKTCAGNLIWVDGEYNVHSGKLMALDIQR